MKRICIIYALFHLTIPLLGQPSYDAKRDYVWIFGGGILNNGVEVSKHVYLDFKYDTMKLSYRQAQGDSFFQTNASICDTAGNFLFYSNGCVLADSGFQYIPGADTINKGGRWNSFCGGYQDITAGYGIVNGCWILPVAENKFKVVYVDKIKSDTLNYTSGIRYTTVLRNSVTGKLSGYGVDKYLYAGSVDPTKRAFVRHGNGRDWWLVNPINYAPKQHFVFLIDSSESVHPPVENETSQLHPMIFNTSGQACFSPDGSIYASLDYENHCLLFDFDRCTGRLSHLRIVKPLIDKDSIGAITGIAISPNSRYLYLMTNTIITQYDLLAPDIEASGVVVAVQDNWAWTVNNVPYPPSFYQAQLGPDGKIYVFNAANRYSFTVVENPDSAGIACKVVQHKYFFPDKGPVRQPPRFPNFRLGPLAGSPCDTLRVATGVPSRSFEAHLRLLPNPATDHVVADVGLWDYNPAQGLSLALSDANGMELQREALPPYASLLRWETALLPSGLYFVTLRVGGRVATVRKLVVQRPP